MMCTYVYVIRETVSRGKWEVGMKEGRSLNEMKEKGRKKKDDGSRGMCDVK